VIFFHGTHMLYSVKKFQWAFITILGREKRLNKALFVGSTRKDQNTRAEVSLSQSCGKIT
ncbi:MAG: hypothetical protein QNK40_03280, partial [Desulfobacterales bacterium]|nr:hypothetical protein [Desulfobacterales bacterium]MDX2508401.1 hypothetical protein [Desulfobacterales bacterium]